MASHAHVLIEADGGSRGNPGPAGYGAVLKDADTGAVIAEAAASVGRASNNVAEYRGLIAGLELYRTHAPDALLEVRMDSKLVIEQMAGRWKIKHPDMRPLAIRGRQLAPSTTRWTWVPREQNKHADRLANLAMDAAARGEVYAVGAPGELDSAGTSPTAVSQSLMIGWSDQLENPTTLICLRHGETSLTATKRFSGTGGDDPPLIEAGRTQAMRAAEALRRDGPVDVLVASPLRRTRETAEIVGNALSLPVRLDDGLRECDFGAWDGLTLAQVQERWPAELAGWLSSADARPPDGESTREVLTRVEETLSKVVASYPGQSVVVVSHVTPIKLIVRRVLDAPIASLHKMELAPASLTTVSFFESGATCLRQFSADPSVG